LKLEAVSTLKTRKAPEEENGYNVYGDAQAGKY